MTLGAPTAINVRLELGADTEAGLRAALLASLRALDQGIEPNTLWGVGWHAAIVPGPVRVPTVTT